MSELSGMAFVYWNEQKKRYELKIDNTLKAHTSGNTQEEHEENKADLAKLAEDKGYTVLDA